MKVVILAGGFGTRLSEKTDMIPKPMVEVGGRPILWHIMKGYATYGYKDFIVALGYKGEVIKDYFVNYRYRASSLGVCLASGNVTIQDDKSEDWTVRLIDTGLHTETGGRIKRLAPWIGKETFMLTWGDGVSDVNMDDLLAFHKSHGKLATLTAVRPPARFGHLELDGAQIVEFSEKPQTSQGWINGAFFVLEPGVFDYIEGDSTPWEKKPLEQLAKDGHLMAYI
ncbi:MAG: glucose-1-phosphate cytidylyltransferase, partial [Candidatus Binatia bacterium]